MIVCVCEGKSERDIRELAAEGHTSLREIGEVSGAGKDCGSCCRQILELLEANRSERTEGRGEGAR